MEYPYISLRNLRFLLHEVFSAASLQKYERYADYDPASIDMALDAAQQLADQYLFPAYAEMDRQKVYMDNGVVRVHPAVGEGIRALAAGGWIAAPDDYAQGGQQMPWLVLNAALSIFYAANANLASHAFLTQGAANLIRTFGSEALQARYVPRMYSGQWQGTMALTEPQAGSSLSDITTTAQADPAGHYLLRGQKVYISGGDHDGVDNVVHLLLARIAGAPAGAKGISLFVVPKKRISAAGTLEDNDVLTAGLFGKMGQRGYVAAHLMLGENANCHGYLVGEPHKGLAYMFQMMNEARVATGLMAAATASAAYYASLQYARERPQGRHPSNKDVNLPQLLIIEHADVRRMLLQQKAIVEGSLSLLMQCSYYADTSKCADGDEAAEAHLLLELLTPVAKSFPAEYGIYAVSAGMQVLGGAGYTDDYPLEQYYRDIRINAIYEGTTTIHGIDLLGRKVLLSDGKAMQLLQAEVAATLAAAGKHPQLRQQLDLFSKALVAYQSMFAHLLKLAGTATTERYLANATLHLECFSLVVIGWQWLKQAVVAAEQPQPADNFYKSKLHTTAYFMQYELPKVYALCSTITGDENLLLDTPGELLV